MGEAGRLLSRALAELMLNAQPACLAAHARAEVLLGKDGMIALLEISDRIANIAVSN
jgi:hypothetical protein